MPGFDGTGPGGMGPRTGGGRGFCAPNAGPYYGSYGATAYYGGWGYRPRWYGGRGRRSFGRGGWGGRAFGRGRGGGWYRPGAYRGPAWTPYGAYTPYWP